MATSSLYGADYRIQLKILITALVAACVVIAVGAAARIERTDNSNRPIRGFQVPAPATPIEIPRPLQPPVSKVPVPAPRIV
jgi:hypothetical protein